MARTEVVAGLVAGGDLGFLLGSALGRPLFLLLAFPALASSSALLLPLPAIGVHALAAGRFPARNPAGEHEQVCFQKQAALDDRPPAPVFP